MFAVPITIRYACIKCNELHRHHIAPQGAKFAIGAATDERPVFGVVIVGNPVARGLNDGWTAEITRLATDGTPNACSFLYSAACRAAKAMGYLKIITYTLESEPGTSLKAAGFEYKYIVKGRSWNTNSRPRDDKHPTTDKIMWQRKLQAGIEVINEHEHSG